MTQPQYLLVRPHPSLQIIFVSPSLRIPGLLRTHLFTKLGGPSATISALELAFRDGASVTAKVLWLPKNTYAGERGRGPADVKPRFIRCTPLLGSDDRVGVWMVILVPVGGEQEGRYQYSGGLGSISLTGSLGRRDHIADMMSDDMILDDKRRYGSYGRVSRAGSRTPSVRKAGSVDGDNSDSFGLRGTRIGERGMGSGRINGFAMGDGGERGVRGEPEDERELYAEYLRGSSGTSGSRDGPNGLNGHPVNSTPGTGRKDSGVT